MTQVQLIIEEFFTRTVLETNDDLLDEKNSGIWKIFHKKVFDVNVATPDIYYFKLKPNESRETIIQALWEYQKSLLPEGIGKFFRHSDGNIYLFPGKIKFYDPETRIITITKFEELIK